MPRTAPWFRPACGTLADVSSQRPDNLAAWDEASAEYAARPQVDWFDGFIERHVGDVAGRRVLDLGVAFEHLDLRRGYEGEFDVVVALMVLMDIPDLAPLRLPEAPVYDGWRRRIPTRVGLAAKPVER